MDIEKLYGVETVYIAKIQEIIKTHIIATTLLIIGNIYGIAWIIVVRAEQRCEVKNDSGVYMRATCRYV